MSAFSPGLRALLAIPPMSGEPGVALSSSWRNWFIGVVKGSPKPMNARVSGP
jgi:hypothetical protein